MGEALITRRGGGNPLAFAEKIMDNITYTGRMLKSINYIDEKPYVLLICETSGTLTVNGTYNGDVWLCGGGGGGGNGLANSSGGSYYGTSGGGGGGYTTNVTGISITSGSVAIGAGGKAAQNGGETSYLTYVANGGNCGTNENGGNGGSGGGSISTPSYGYYNPGTGQGNSTRPFLSKDMLPACAGGGAGHGAFGGYESGCCGGSDGSDGTTTGGGYGGEFGGGNGGKATSGYHSRGTDGTYYGCGGGGGGYVGANNSIDHVGWGHDGAVMIRIAL